MSGALRQFTARRSSGFDPLSIDWHSVFWAEDLALADGDPVIVWPNAGSGDFGDATQPNALSQPHFYSSHWKLNNQPALQFTASWMRTGIVESMLPQPNSVVVIFAGDGQNSLVFDGVDAARTYLYLTNGYTVSAGTSAGTSFNTDALGHLLVIEYNSPNATFMRDGVSGISSGEVGAYGPKGITIGANYVNGGLMYGGIAFLGLFDGLLSAQQKTDLLLWSQEKYGTP